MRRRTHRYFDNDIQLFCPCLLVSESFHRVFNGFCNFRWAETLLQSWDIYYRSAHLRSVRQQIGRLVEHMVAWIYWDCSVSRLLTWHNQEITQWSRDPFPYERVGSGLKTRQCRLFTMRQLQCSQGHARMILIHSRIQLIIQLWSLAQACVVIVAPLQLDGQIVALFLFAQCCSVLLVQARPICIL